jgi:hypothetical protein
MAMIGTSFVGRGRDAFDATEQNGADQDDKNDLG